MGQLLLLLALMVVYATYLVHSQEELYPDWRCHPGYVSSLLSGPLSGEAWIKFVMDRCNQEMDSYQVYAPEKVCFKSCVLAWHSITPSIGSGKYDSRLLSETAIADGLSYTFTDDEESTNKIAKRVVADCTELGSKLPQSTTCGDRTEFFSCLEKAWSCEEQTTENPNEYDILSEILGIE